MKKNDDIQQIINVSEIWMNLNPYQSTQFNISDYNKLTKEFIEFCLPLCEEIFCEELDCSKSFRREQTNKTTKWILKYHNYSIGTGIKWVRFPIGQIMKWEKWERGYIELFTRICHPSGVDYFIWGYIKFPHLEKILNKFKNKIILPHYLNDYMKNYGNEKN